MLVRLSVAAIQCLSKQAPQSSMKQSVAKEASLHTSAPELQEQCDSL